ncbi:hypothetical protein [Stigmatella erecta]|uniref:hypothetical protein n=1 Tax=Stigmatella erecta TaxID=83460 RepID=UPI0015A640C0|nr:hypothetical protein [Stigmatella erecta]
MVNAIANGQLGNSSGNFSHRTPGQIPGQRDVVSVSAGSYHSFAVNAEGSVWAWGRTSMANWETMARSPCVGPLCTGGRAEWGDARGALRRRQRGSVLGGHCLR